MVERLARVVTRATPSMCIQFKMCLGFATWQYSHLHPKSWFHRRSSVQYRGSAVDYPEEEEISLPRRNTSAHCLELYDWYYVLVCRQGDLKLVGTSKDMEGTSEIMVSRGQVFENEWQTTLRTHVASLQLTSNLFPRQDQDHRLS